MKSTKLKIKFENGFTKIITLPFDPMDKTIDNIVDDYINWTMCNIIEVEIKRPNGVKQTYEY